MSFSQSLLFDLDLQLKRGDGVLGSCKVQAEFYAALAKAESAHASTLQKLAAHYKNQFEGDKVADYQRETGSTRTAWRVVLNEIDQVAKTHQDFANALETDITKPINQFAKDKVKPKKKLISDTAKIQKEWKAAQEKLQKSRDTYVGKCKDAENAAAAHTKAQEDPNNKPSAVAKLAAKSSQLHDKAASADNDYQAMLSQTNKKQHDYYTTTVPTILAEWQKWEEDRLVFMNGTFKKFVSLLESFPRSHQGQYDSIKGAADRLNVDEDIKSYCQEQGQNEPVPQDIPYTPHDGELPATPGSGGGKGGKGAAGAPGAGASKKKKFDARKYGANDVAELEALLEKETKAADGLENLVKFYASDPAAQKEAQQELEEAQVQIRAMESHLRKLKGGDGPSAISQTHDEPPETPAEDSDEPEEDAGGDGETWEAKGLYDYEATCDTELSFAEGEALTVTQKDDSGWWYVTNAAGKMGFVPNNYVELV